MGTGPMRLASLVKLQTMYPFFNPHFPLQGDVRALFQHLKHQAGIGSPITIANMFLI